MFKKTQFITFCFLVLSTLVFAQQKFNEGIIVYDVTISGKVPTPANEPALVETKSGTMTLYLKDENIRQDIELEDGYTHSRISNYIANKDLILQTINTVKYAIEVSLKEQRKKNAHQFNALVTDGKASRKIGGYQAVEGNVKYKDGSSFSLFYIKDYELKHPEIFEKTPELKGVPASFDILMSNGFTTHFELKHITPEPVANTIFRIPEGYRIISKKEYDKLIR